jgi:hypothetical protein
VSLITIKPRRSAAPTRPWYADGIRFECQRSTKCCVNHGEYAYVYLRRDDEARLAAHLGLELKKFRNRYTDAVHGRRIIRFAEGSCAFLVGQGCSVYEARPAQCATWPFWPENMDETVWREEIAAFCPGVGKGKLWSQEAIEEVMARLPQEDD